MKIRITQNVMYKADQVFSPGLVMDIEDEQALEWIEQGRAVLFEDEQPKPRKAVKAVDNGNG